MSITSLSLLDIYLTCSLVDGCLSPSSPPSFSNSEAFFSTGTPLLLDSYHTSHTACIFHREEGTWDYHTHTPKHTPIHTVTYLHSWVVLCSFPGYGLPLFMNKERVISERNEAGSLSSRNPWQTLHKYMYSHLGLYLHPVGLHLLYCTFCMACHRQWMLYYIMSDLPESCIHTRWV